MEEASPIVPSPKLLPEMTTEPIPDDSSGHEGTVEASFAVLELCLEQLGGIAPVHTPEQILDLIPDVSLAAQRLILVELIKFDLAVAAESEHSRNLDFYWPTAANMLPQESIPFDLVLEEVQLRRAAGEKPKWADYRQRFPDLADTIGKWLAGGDTQDAAATTSSVPELPVGGKVDDFQILKQLGQGAFARVYLARQESMARLVALKATSRGSEEPQALSRLDHANVVRVYDQREIADPPTILLYMQYLAGGTLADCIKHMRSLAPESWNGRRVLESIDRNLLDASQTVPEQSPIRNRLQCMEWAEFVAWLGVQLAEGLDYANQKNVLHRDVKPANILMSAEGIPKLADFNVSCSGLSGRAGAAAYFGGSLAYMSPEQLQVADPMENKAAEELDGRSDLYALGIVLWELWQGKRPWSLDGLASNWMEAVSMQRAIRAQPFETPRRAVSAAERVLEKVLRSLLEVEPDRRPATGGETAARLRLAFYPELANRFEPDSRSVAGRLLSIPVLLLAALLIFGPNTAASVFNYHYNDSRMLGYARALVEEHGHGPEALEALEQRDVGPKDSVDEETLATLPNVQTPAGKSEHEGPEEIAAVTAKLTPEQLDKLARREPLYQYFVWLSKLVNTIVFPLGAVLFLVIVVPLARIVERAKRDIAARPEDLTTLWHIGNRATLICGVLWTVSGCVFAYFMSTNFPQYFQAEDAFHFFLSLVLCGGVAWIYPYFGMTLLSLLVYYPKVIAPSMSDPMFAERCRTLRTHSSWYLMSAAAIPLTAVGALVFRDELPAGLVLAGVCITGLGLFVAYFAHTRLDAVLNLYAKVLGSRDTSQQV